MGAVRHFTLEIDRPAEGWGDLQLVTARARRAAEQMREEGRGVRFLRSVFVPEDDTCFFLYESPNATAVREAARRAELAAGALHRTLTEVDR
jgi:uncharacterized protein DUF4242